MIGEFTKSQNQRIQAAWVIRQARIDIIGIFFFESSI